MKPIVTKPLQIQITGRNIKLTDTIRNMVNEKFEKLKRHFNHITHIHVTLKVNKVDRNKPKDGIKQLKKLQTAKALILLPDKHEIIAEESTDDLYNSIDVLVDTLDRQLI